MSPNAIVDIVTQLNEQLYDSNPELGTQGICFSYHTDGYSECVGILDVCLWDSDNDERKTTESGDYEDLEDYLRREFNKLIYDLQKVRL